MYVVDTTGCFMEKVEVGVASPTEVVVSAGASTVTVSLDALAPNNAVVTGDIGTVTVPTGESDKFNACACPPLGEKKAAPVGVAVKGVFWTVVPGVAGTVAPKRCV